ncbi:MAG: hypothetical protein L0Z50_41650 [Verrucomicrobiales bacterium]|nr:hypothetical protein [Verrucomicrobiales bacterium]
MRTPFWLGRLTRVLLLWAATSNAFAQAVDIPDSGLRDAIRQALGKSTGDITVADMQSLTTLDASRSTRGADAPLIGTLEGLQAAGNLTVVYLWGTSGGWGSSQPNLETGDLRPMAGLTNLSTLDLGTNQPELARIHTSDRIHPWRTIVLLRGLT